MIILFLSWQVLCVILIEVYINFVRGYSCESTTSDTKCLKSQKVSVVENRREFIVQHKTSTTQEKDKNTQIECC